MKRNIFAAIILLSAFLCKAQNGNYPVMYSNKKNISYIVNGVKDSWTIDPELTPDVLRLYDAVKKTYDVKFVSDLDSLSFQVEANKPIYFWVIYRGDSALTKIDFTDHFPNTLTNEQKLYALSLFWSEVRYNFAFIDKLSFDWDSLYQAYIPKILDTKDDYEFYDQMQLFATTLKDGHTNVYYDNRSAYTDYIPIGARFFKNELYITNTREDIKETFPLGAKILEINGMSVNDYIKKYIEPYIDSNFEPTAKLLSSIKLFSSDIHSNVLTIKYQTPDKKILVNTLPRDGRTRQGKSIGYIPKRHKNIEINWLENNIAVLEFNTFYNQDGQLITYFETLKDTLYYAEGIIIDMRQNGGGMTNVAWHLLQYMIKESYFLNIGSQTRVNDGVKRANGNWIPEYEDFYTMKAYETSHIDTIYIPDSIKRFDVPMVVLISSMTVSAAEDFLIMLYERNDRPKFIGRPSFGSTGSPLIVWNWPDENGFARVCTRRCLFPYSLKPFSEGIMPDILVEYTYDEYMSGKDKDVEVAVKELKKQIKDKNK